MVLAVPYLGSVMAHSGCLCTVGDTAAHLEQVGAPDSAQLVARAEPVVCWEWSSFPRARRGPNVSPETVLICCFSDIGDVGCLVGILNALKILERGETLLTREDRFSFIPNFQVPCC